MKVLRKDIYEFYKALSSIKSGSYTKYFLKFLHKNKTFLRTIVSEIDEEARKVNSTEYNNLLKVRDTILEKYCERDDDGSVKIENNSIKIKEDSIKICREELDKLLLDNKKILENFEILDRKFGEYINEEIEVEIEQIDFEQLPETLESDVFEIIKKFVIGI